MQKNRSEGLRPFACYIFLFFLIYAAFGFQSPFLPRLLEERGLTPSVLGFFLSAATCMRLLAAPMAGYLADRRFSIASILTLAMASSGVFSLLYLLPAHGFLLFFILTGHAFLLGPVVPLADAMAVWSAKRKHFSYGKIRGTGSAAFIAGVLISGQFVAVAGIRYVFVANAILVLLASALVAYRLNREEVGRECFSKTALGRETLKTLLLLLRIPVFRLVILISGLILGSHALHDGFTMIRWHNAGLSPKVSSFLWSLTVASEVVIFFVFGEPLLNRFGPRTACLISLSAALLRWCAMAMTTSVSILIPIQLLHGLTFALLHLTCMRLIVRAIPEELAGTAQGVYSTLGPGIASVTLTILSGFLYAHFGPAAFWFMAGLAAASFPAILRLKPLLLLYRHPEIHKLSESQNPSSRSSL